MINQGSGPTRGSYEIVQNQLTHRWALKNVIAQLHNHHYLNRREKIICFDWLESRLVSGRVENLALLSHILNVAHKTRDHNILVLFLDFAFLFSESKVSLIEDTLPQLVDVIQNWQQSQALPASLHQRIYDLIEIQSVHRREPKYMKDLLMGVACCMNHSDIDAEWQKHAYTRWKFILDKYGQGENYGESASHFLLFLADKPGVAAEIKTDAINTLIKIVSHKTFLTLFDRLTIVNNLPVKEEMGELKEKVVAALETLSRDTTENQTIRFFSLQRLCPFATF